MQNIVKFFINLFPSLARRSVGPGTPGDTTAESQTTGATSAPFSKNRTLHSKLGQGFVKSLRRKFRAMGDCCFLPTAPSPGTIELRENNFGHRQDVIQISWGERKLKLLRTNKLFVAYSAYFAVSQQLPVLRICFVFYFFFVFVFFLVSSSSFKKELPIIIGNANCVGAMLAEN